MKIHITKQGDTLEMLASKYSVSHQDLLGLNSHINPASTLTPGLKLKIPQSRNFDTTGAEHIQKYYPNIDTTGAKIEHPNLHSTPIGAETAQNGIGNSAENFHVFGHQTENISTHQHSHVQAKESHINEKESQASEKGQAPHPHPWYDPWQVHAYYEQLDSQRKFFPGFVPGFFPPPFFPFYPVPWFGFGWPRPGFGGGWHGGWHGGGGHHRDADMQSTTPPAASTPPHFDYPY